MYVFFMLPTGRSMFNAVWSFSWVFQLTLLWLLRGQVSL